MTHGSIFPPHIIKNLSNMCMYLNILAVIKSHVRCSETRSAISCHSSYRICLRSKKSWFMILKYCPSMNGIPISYTACFRSHHCIQPFPITMLNHLITGPCRCFLIAHKLIRCKPSRRWPNWCNSMAATANSIYCTNSSKEISFKSDWSMAEKESEKANWSSKCCANPPSDRSTVYASKPQNQTTWIIWLCWSANAFISLSHLSPA